MSDKVQRLIEELKELIPVKVLPCTEKRFPVSLDYKIYWNDLNHVVSCLGMLVDNKEEPYIIYGIYEDFVGLGIVNH